MPAGSAAADWLSVLFAPALSDRQRRAMIASTRPGASWAQRAQSDPALAQCADVRHALARGTQQPGVSAALDWLCADDQHLMTLDDADYPALLRELADPPLALYIKGRRALLEQPSLAVIGSRNASALGEQTAQAFSRSLSRAGLTVISGLALGIDAAAHRGALAGAGGTIGVVGTGLDIVYPARNRSLAQQIAAEGALVSEYPLGAAARADHFPRRNRILSGLALGCLVVEANLRSGSLITARLAAEQGREVFAIPGSIHSPLSKGCHSLIKQGAKLTESAADIIEELGWHHSSMPAQVEGKASSHPKEQPLLDHEFSLLLEVITYHPTSVDTLAEQLGWPFQRLAAGLLTLELGGRIARAGHGMYQRLADPGYSGGYES